MIDQKVDPIEQLPTPAPWHVIDSYRNATEKYKKTQPRDIHIFSEVAGFPSVAEVASIPPASPLEVHERELANARLIASAPDLLAALRRMLECHQAAMDAAQSSASAIVEKRCECGACDEARSAIAKAEGRP